MAKKAEEIFIEIFIRRSPVKIKEEDFKKDREIIEAIVECMESFAAQEVGAYKERMKAFISREVGANESSTLNEAQLTFIIDAVK